MAIDYNAGTSPPAAISFSRETFPADGVGGYSLPTAYIIKAVDLLSFFLFPVVCFPGLKMVASMPQDIPRT